MIYKGAAKTGHPITSRELNSAIDVHDYICVFSFEFGRACGRVSERSTTVDLGVGGDGEDETFINSFEFSVLVPGVWTCSTSGTQTFQGASGGAVTNGAGRKAVGVVSSCSSANYEPNDGGTVIIGTASKIQNVEIELGVSVLTS